MLTCAIGIMGRIFKLSAFMPVLIIAFGLLAFSYTFLSFFLFKEKTQKFQKISLSVISGILLGIAMQGILFQLMFWPGEAFFLFLGGFGALLMFMVVFSYWRTDHAHKDYYNLMLTRIAIVGGLAMILYLIPSPHLFAYFHNDDTKLIKLYTRHYNHPENEEYKEAYKQYTREKYGYSKEDAGM